MPREGVEHHTGLRADDVGGYAGDAQIHGERRDHAQHRDGCALQHHGEEDGVGPRAQRPEDGDVAAAFVHRVVDAREHGAGGHGGDEPRDEFQHLVKPRDFAEQLGDHLRDGPRERQPVALLVIHQLQPAPGDGVLELHQHGADLGGALGVVALHVLDAFERNPDDAVGGRVRRLEDAGDDVEFLVLLFLVEVQPVIRMKLVAHLELQLPGREAPEHRLHVASGELLAFRDAILAPRRVLDGEEVRGGPDEPVAAVVVTHGDG